MLTISVKSNLDAIMRDFERKYVKQIPFAMAKALTDTARDVQQEVTRQLPEIFDRPTPFTMRAIGFSRATKQSLTSTVFVKDIQAAYLKLEVLGGTRTPAKRALVLPTDLPTNQYGNIPRGQIKRLLARRDVFSGKVRGIAGIWQRTAARGLILLVAYEPKATYPKRFPFYDIGKRVVMQRIEPNFRAAWAYAVATAR